MTDREKDRERRRPDDELSDEELAAQRGGPLPDREALSVLNADVAIPADPAIAADVLAGDEPAEENIEDAASGDEGES
jgi:hypothetical protein